MNPVDLLPFVLMAGAFWLLIMRPAKNRRDAAAALVAALTPGQRVMTTAGLYGTIVAIDGDTVQLEIAPGVVVEIVAAAIARTVETPVDAATADVESAREVDSSSEQGSDRG